MKIYKIKEGIRRHLHQPMSEILGKHTLIAWNQLGWGESALEEVEDRIRIKVYIIEGEEHLANWKATDNQIDICEKAINGELFTKEEIVEFDKWIESKKDK